MSTHRGRPRVSARGRPISHPYTPAMPNLLNRPRNLPRLVEGDYFSNIIRTRSRETSMLSFSPDAPSAEYLKSPLPLSDVRLFGVDTEDFPMLNAAIRPEQYGQYFWGVGWDNVQSVLTLRAVLPSLSKLDEILQQLRFAGSAAVPLAAINTQPHHMFAGSSLR
jgi:hypothetical protein